MKKQPNKYARIYALINKLGLSDEEKKALVYSHTNQRTTSLKEATDEDLESITNYLVAISPPSTQPKGMKDSFGKPNHSNLNNMRRKVIALLAHDLGWKMYSKTKNSMVADMTTIKAWVKKYGRHKKDLNELNKQELAELITQCEEFVRRELNK
jgi:hypothetical protein